jgi:hypothetical protein
MVGLVGGISTGGGHVRITTGGILTVKGKINTQPGKGGDIRIEGNGGHYLRLEAKRELGAGNITFVVPG